MIIKRRVTSKFVQIANETARDTRFSLEAHGLLDYLLSLPDDWEINLKHLEKTWKIGRDKRRRIFRELHRFGWAQLERITADDGVTFLGQRWIIGDEPGPESADEAIIDDEGSEDADEGAPTKTTAAPEGQTPDALVSASRETPFQAVGSPDGRVSRPPENTALPRRKTSDEERDSTNTSDGRSNDDSDDAGEPPPLFGELLRLWPRDNVVSAFACERIFAKWPDRMKCQARDGIRPYLEECRAKGQNRLCDLKTYLDERRFEKFIGSAPRRQLAVTKRGTPQAFRWREYLERVAPEKLRMFDYMLSTRGETTTESEWPPPIDPQAKAS